MQLKIIVQPLQWNGASQYKNINNISILSAVALFITSFWSIDLLHYSGYMFLAQSVNSSDSCLSQILLPDILHSDFARQKKISNNKITFCSSCEQVLHWLLQKERSLSDMWLQNIVVQSLVRVLSHPNTELWKMHRSPMHSIFWWAQISFQAVMFTT